MKSSKSLYHWGVLGMHWGSRNSGNTTLKPTYNIEKKVFMENQLKLVH